MTAHEQHDEYADIRDAVAKLCAQFPGEYWRKLDREMAYPTEFVNALTEAGYLSVLIPEEYGGAGPEAVGRGRDPGRDPARRLQWRRLPRPDVHDGHGAAARQRGAEGEVAARRSPAASCGCRPLASPNRPAAPIPSSLKTVAKRDGNDGYIVNGQKIWTSRAEHSDLMVLLARTTPKEQAKKRTDGLVGVPRRHAGGERHGPRRSARSAP